ncbi:hypothetical protein BJY01DRAFT_228769 [Aspergillus pseudoustus]|uniref:Uncharacterized protein n=1 Tax=Aspergillus pseudoustus TaxID=1810923 RepID=A0ABR4IJF8_9EURO
MDSRIIVTPRILRPHQGVGSPCWQLFVYISTDGYYPTARLRFVQLSVHVFLMGLCFVMAKLNPYCANLSGNDIFSPCT